MRVVGDRDALELTGMQDDGGDTLVVLGDAAVPADAGGRVLRWRRDPPALVDGDALVSEAPWPVADALFDAAPADDGAPVLVVGSGEAAEALRDRGIAVAEAATVTRSGLAAANVVVTRLDPGASPAADVFAVLASARLLITCAQPRFGLRPGVDHLHAREVDRALDLAELAFAMPSAFAATRRLARLAARPFRASEVCRRLVV